MSAFDPATLAVVYKAPLGDFLAQNPFPHRLTLGFFYREKMRAIHRIAPEQVTGPILEVGGGRGGLTGLLYPGATIVNVDIDRELAKAEPNRRPGIRFVCADATRLPFADATFGAVTMFDLLEHVPDDRGAAREAERVLRPGSTTLVSTPSENWRYPFHRVFSPLVPPQREIMDRWGHVRIGYSLADLTNLFGRAPETRAPFINALSVISHDLTLTHWPARVRRALCVALSPLTLAGYLLRDLPGTEWAARWRKD